MLSPLSFISANTTKAMLEPAASKMLATTSIRWLQTYGRNICPCSSGARRNFKGDVLGSARKDGGIAFSLVLCRSSTTFLLHQTRLCAHHASKVIPALTKLLSATSTHHRRKGLCLRAFASMDWKSNKRRRKKKNVLQQGPLTKAHTKPVIHSRLETRNLQLEFAKTEFLVPRHLYSMSCRPIWRTRQEWKLLDTIFKIVQLIALL